MLGYEFGNTDVWSGPGPDRALVLCAFLLRDAEARAALDAVKSEAMSKRRAVMVCEVQFLLRPYLEARREMHLLYKVVRAASDEHLAQQFAVAEEGEGRGVVTD